MIIGHAAVGDAANEGADLLRRQRAAVALLANELDGVHVTASKKLSPRDRGFSPNPSASVCAMS